MLVEVEFGDAGFYGGRGTKETQRKSLGTINSTHIHAWHWAKIKHGLYCWKASALTICANLIIIAVTDLPKQIIYMQSLKFEKMQEFDNG